MRFLFLVILIIHAVGIYAQKKTDFSETDKFVLSLPDSLVNSTDLFSGTLKQNLSSEKEILRAVYVWIAKNISYDIDNMYRPDYYEKNNDLVQNTLKTRKAICQGYSELFNELCRKSGIQTYVVSGYTQQEGKISGLDHAWVVASLDSGWYCFDPTWGSGYAENDKFIKRYTGDYFLVKPEEFIKTHMPFDPIWQCLDFPVSHRDFYDHAFARAHESTYFAFADSIAQYEKLPVLKKQEAELRRIEENGIKNDLIYDRARYLKQSIESEKINQQNAVRNQSVDRYNNAVNHYNASVNLFNDYINYYNRQFKPSRSDAQIRHMIDTCDMELTESVKLLSGVIYPDPAIKQNKEYLIQGISNLQAEIDKQKAFLRKYFETSKASRSSLFRKYTWFGVPLN